MNLLFTLSKIYTPDFLKKKELMNLFRITASVFGKPVPAFEHKSYDECLTVFARFTKSEVDELIIRGEDMQPIHDRLYQSAVKVGETFRKRFHVTTTHDVMEVSAFIYRNLGIDFHGTEQGVITISRCFFSRMYSSSTCRVISSLDAGLMAGLSNGGLMVFFKRITEGSDCCQAQFILKEQFQ